MATRRSSFSALALLVTLAACGSDPADAGDDDAPATDAGNTGNKDAGTADTGSKPADTGTANPGDSATLTALAGRYLLRFDNFGTAMSAPFTIRSRVSVLVTAELTVDGGKLAAKERVCNQVVLQECKTDACTSANTVVDAKAISDFLVKRTFTRTYSLDGTSFTADSTTYAIGYDDTSNGDVPNASTDARVWDVVKGDPREGLLTKLTVTLPAPLPAISCNVYGTQKFISTFTGALTGSGASAAFPTAELLADLDGSDAKTLGSDVAQCQTQDGSSVLEKSTVRIVRVGDASSASWDCPSAADFDKKLPGGAL